MTTTTANNIDGSSFDVGAFEKAWDDFHDAMKPLSLRIGFTFFKEYKSMSEETMCFSANITLDGVKVGRAKNDGHGGCTDIVFDDKTLWNTLSDEISRLWNGNPEDRLDLETFMSSLAFDVAGDKDWDAYAKRAVKRGATAFRCAKLERPRKTYGFVAINSRNPESIKKTHEQLTSQGLIILAQK